MLKKHILILFGIILTISMAANCRGAEQSTLDQIKKRGVLRHIGVPYANFVTTDQKGLSILLIKEFAVHLGVEYEYVESDWDNVISDLVGYDVTHNGKKVILGRKRPVKGDLIANGLTILEWRKKIIDFSAPTFPTQVWLACKSNHRLRPAQIEKSEAETIKHTKSLIKGLHILGVKNTCLDPSLYGLEQAGAIIHDFQGNLNELAPAIIKGSAEATLLDVPDALVALQKWPGQIKIIGPVSPRQDMGVAFRPESRDLLDEFNKFYFKIRNNGMYSKMIKKYYHSVFNYYPRFFSYQ
ncbi:MAG: transporter substrate-binding domain-containing protein [Thermodesulfobacteriota bacterium]